jgi:hypothetical protein
VEPHQSRALDIAQEPDVVLAEASGADHADADIRGQITTPR